MANKFFSAQVLEDAIIIARNNLRDLRGQSLAGFYTPADPVPSGELAERVKAVAKFRAANGLQRVSTTEAADQIATPKSAQTFRRVVTNVGLEVEFEEDLVTLDGTEPIPRLGYRTQFVADKVSAGADVTISEVRARLQDIQSLRDRLPSVEDTLHVLESAPTAVADEDSRVLQAQLQMQQYVRQYLRTS